MMIDEIRSSMERRSFEMEQFKVSFMTNPLPETLLNLDELYGKITNNPKGSIDSESKLFNLYL